MVGKDSLSVLWIEDDPNDVLLIRRALKKAGLEPVHICSNGEDAVDYLEGVAPYEDRTRFPFPTVIVTDLKMPKCDGIDFLKWVRAHKQLCMLPVVVFSASAEARDIQQAYRLGANAFFQKPIGLDRIVEVVGRILDYWREAVRPDAVNKCD
jgi:CheY-like chemotaxis protein